MAAVSVRNLDAEGLLDAIRERLGEVGGVELDLPPRTAPARGADLPG